MKCVKWRVAPFSGIWNNETFSKLFESILIFIDLIIDKTQQYKKKVFVTCFSGFNATEIISNKINKKIHTLKEKKIRKFRLIIIMIYCQGYGKIYHTMVETKKRTIQLKKWGNENNV